MSRWIDAEWLLNFFVDIPNNFTLTIGNLRATVDDAPSIEIIHCRECKHYKLNGACMRLDRKMLAVRPNDFCSYGMRNADPNTLNTLDALDDNSSEKPNNSTISKMEQVDEPQKWTKENCKGCKYNEYPYDSGTCFVRVCINGNKYEPKDEPQTKRPIQCSECRAWHRCFKEKPSYNMIKSRCPIDEPHTERSSE